MAKREIPEISAGSMADIAFLLLIFFLVTTTMDKDTGILRQMSMKIDIPIEEQVEVAKRNLMKISANAQGQLLIRKDMATLADVRGKVDQFYRTNMAAEMDVNWPRYNELNAFKIDSAIQAVDDYIALTPKEGQELLIEFKEAERKEWVKRQNVLESLGTASFREIELVAAIQIELQTRTDYQLLISILNEVKAAINDIRDEKALELFGISYRQMIQLGTTNPEKELEYAANVELIEILIPERIVELKPADLAK
jgi:biopolymer transport protein ExbD